MYVYTGWRTVSWCIIDTNWMERKGSEVVGGMMQVRARGSDAVANVPRFCCPGVVAECW